MEAHPRNRILPVLLAIALLPLIPAADSTATPTEPMVIVGEEVWADEDRVVNEHVVVAPGATLTIRNSVLNWQAGEFCTPGRINGMYCAGEIQVQPGGTLVIEDSTITSTSDDVTDWPLIEVFGDLQATGNTFHRVVGVLVQGNAATGHIVDNTVDHAFTGINVWRGASALVQGNHIRDVGTGLSAQDASPVLRGNVLEDISGFGIRVQQSIVGDKIYVTNPLIEGNLFNNASQGVFSDTGAGMVVRDNTFVDHRFHAINVRVPTQDFMLQQAPLAIEGNRFVDNHRVLDINTVDGVLPKGDFVVEMHGNAIVGTTCNHINADEAVTAALTIDATGNWWGTADGPQDPSPEEFCEAFDGDAEIRIEPWLESEPALDAPPVP